MARGREDAKKRGKGREEGKREVDDGAWWDVGVVGLGGLVVV